MDKETFLQQLAFVLAHGGTTTIKRNGKYFVFKNDETKVVVPQQVVPWFTSMYYEHKRVLT